MLASPSMFVGKFGMNVEQMVGFGIFSSVVLKKASMRSDGNS